MKSPTVIEFLGAGVQVSPDLGVGATQRHVLAELTARLVEPRISVIGANGSGKSTLLRMINGLVRPSTGSVTVGGIDTVANGPAVRRSVGFMFTDPLSQLVMPTPREDIELSLRRRYPHRAERRAAAEQLLTRFGLHALAEQSVYDLSAGERQLVALASILAVSPQILVLDEPTTLLDLANTMRLRALLEELSTHMQIVLATHDLELAAEADRLLWVDRGAVAYDGAPCPGIDRYRQACRQRMRS